MDHGMHFPFAFPFGFNRWWSVCGWYYCARACGALCTTYSGRTPSPLVMRLLLQHVNVLDARALVAASVYCFFSLSLYHFVRFSYLFRLICLHKRLLFVFTDAYGTSIMVYLPLASIEWPVGNEMCPCLLDCRNAVHGWENEKHRHATCGYNSFPISFAFFSLVCYSNQSLPLAVGCICWFSHNNNNNKSSFVNMCMDVNQMTSTTPNW